jgi:hypothetical protein
MICGTDRFGHREDAGIVSTCSGTAAIFTTNSVWRFKDRRDGTRFVLYPATGREAIQAFHHPFSAPPGTRAA